MNTFTILLSIFIVFSFDISYVKAQENPNNDSPNQVNLKTENKQPGNTTETTDIKSDIKGDSEEQEEINAKDYLPNEINELNEDNITTKIYKSSDPSLDLFEDNSSLDPSVENDVLSKDELFQNNKKNKYYRRNKKTESNVINLSSKHTMLPWLILISMVILLGVIFNYLKKKKLY